jgi:hypothetical protein
MTVQKWKKLNLLEDMLPEGLLVSSSWMEERGYSSSLRSQYVAAGWLKQPVHSIFWRPRGKLSWEHVVISMQNLLDLPISIGGQTALELQGYAHYLQQSRKIIYLYSDKKLSTWVGKLELDEKLVIRNRSRFLPKIEHPWIPPSILEPLIPDELLKLDGALRVSQWGQYKWPLIMSTPERAILELLDELPKNTSFHLVDVIMEGLVNIRPRRMQTLLEQTSSIKVKRLFFFFVDRYHHRWLKHIDRDKIDLGKGKRVLVKGGKLNPKYQITMPENF